MSTSILPEVKQFSEVLDFPFYELQLRIELFSRFFNFCLFPREHIFVFPRPSARQEKHISARSNICCKIFIFQDTYLLDQTNV